MEVVSDLLHAKHRVYELGFDNVAVVYSYTSVLGGKTDYRIFRTQNAANARMSLSPSSVKVAWTPEEGWIDEG